METVLLRIVFAYLLLLAPTACTFSATGNPEPLSNFPQTTVEIATPDAHLHRFKVWVADTDAHREQGLMFVKDLPEDAGMLFIFPQPARVGFWMKNTLIPLDMLFIRADGRVDSIAANATPLSLKVIESQGEVPWVLELKGGVAKRLGIAAGAQVSTPSK